MAVVRLNHGAFNTMFKRKRVKNLSEHALALEQKRGIKQEYGTVGDRAELEKRLDSVVYRLGFAAGRRAARQLVSHRHISLNGKRINIPSIKIKAGDKIQMLNPKLLPAEFKKHKTPEWIKLNRKNLSAEIINQPSI